MNKPKLFLDFDGTLVNTIEAICSIYNEDFVAYKKYKKVNWEDINTWNFEELNASTPEYINSYFNQPRFFNRLKYMPNAEYIIGELSKDYDITIVSSGYSPNLCLKGHWVKEHLPYCKFIGVNFKEYSDKAHVDMDNGVFIDDSINNLITSNAKIKLCFGKKYPWNESWTGTRLNTWDDILNYLKGEK